ncbi:glycoside hydrolase superfamily [Microdochium bolleyi]|uniref:beta-glucosidase n=1 Tax=Microdochium bolleyi TaxID=196109 RepID=A0A136IKY3_9PEZI|nr:glycoside hydrolase superfamily [Microdochium bolleyi]
MANVALLPQLTLDEKISLLSGDTFRSTPAVPRLGINALCTSDGINGVRPAAHDSEMTTACFPNTTCLASTWDADLLGRLGERLVHEAQMKSSQLVLGPTINMHRDPRAGRNFECFSEDPLLSGQLAGAIVNGIQAGGAGSVPKHIVCNDAEFMRHFYNVDLSLDSRVAREIYLAAWQHLLRTSDPVGLMTAYNKVNGQSCSENQRLIDIVRNDWGYKGFFMSDWFGTYNTVAPLKAGLDLEMPFPVQRGARLKAAVESGQVRVEDIDARVKKMLEARDRTNLSHRYEQEYSEQIPETMKVARELAAGGIVLLKNDNQALPIATDTESFQRTAVAVIGEFAQRPVVTGGGSASCNPQYLIPPVEAIRKALGSDPNSTDRVQYSAGVRTRRIIPMASAAHLQSDNGNPGITVRYYNDEKPHTPVYEEDLEKATVWMFGHFKPGLQVPGSHLVLSTRLTAPSTGSHTFAVRATGAFTLELDGKEVLAGQQPDVTPEQTLFNHVRLESRCEVPLTGGQAYDIRLTMKSRDKLNVGEPTPYAVTLCFEEHLDEQATINDAVRIARNIDTAVIFAGRDGQYESEGFDMESIKMPENQTRLIRAVAAVAQRTVVVLHSGNPIDVSAFIDDVDAVLAAHFYGQEGPNALADILTGKVNPSGRLATTWPKKLELTPSFRNFPAKKDANDHYTIRYEEGLQLGYRHPDPTWVQWPFGHGLSYTDFSYANLTTTIKKTPASEGQFLYRLVCTVCITNSGPVAGHEVVQVYITPCSTSQSSSTWRPQKELKGFSKVLLQPGEARVVTVEMDLKAACSYWDEDRVSWSLERGTYGLAVGQLRASFEVEESASWNHL